MNGPNLPRRRLQRKGNLYKQGGYWKLRWRIDVPKTPENPSGREWSAPVWLAPCAGPEAVSKREAQRIAWDEHLSKLDANIRTPKSGMSLRHFVESRFIPDCVGTEADPVLKKAGRVHYDSMLKHILPFIGDMRLRDIDVSTVQSLVRGLKAKRRTVGGVNYVPASAQTQKHVRNVLSAIFEHAIRLEYIDMRNPARS